MPTEQEYINYKDFVESLDEATPSANDKAVFNDANGPKGSVFSAIATFVHDTFAAFVNALTAKTSFASGDKIPVVNGSTATAMEADTLLELTAQNAMATGNTISKHCWMTSSNPQRLTNVGDGAYSTKFVYVEGVSSVKVSPQSGKTSVVRFLTALPEFEENAPLPLASTPGTSVNEETTFTLSSDTKYMLVGEIYSNVEYFPESLTFDGLDFDDFSFDNIPEKILDLSKKTSENENEVKDIDRRLGGNTITKHCWMTSSNPQRLTNVGDNSYSTKFVYVEGVSSVKVSPQSGKTSVVRFLTALPEFEENAPLPLASTPGTSVNEETTFTLSPDTRYMLVGEIYSNVKYFPESLTFDGLDFDVYSLDSYEKELESIKNDLQTDKVMLKKDSSTQFSLYKKLNNGKVAKFVWTRATWKSQDNGIEVVDNDCWVARYVYVDGVAIAQCNINFIYLMTENEGGEDYVYFVGSGHGCCVENYVLFFIDGHRVDFSSLSSGEELVGKEIRIVISANVWAASKARTIANGGSTDKVYAMVDSESKPILSTIWLLDYVFDASGEHYINQLTAKRNNTRFVQCYGAMNSTQPNEFDNLVENDQFGSRCSWVYENNEHVITSISGQNLESELIKGVSKATQYGSNYTLSVECENIVEPYKGHVRNWFENGGTGRMKVYLNPIKTTQSDGESASVLGDGDIIRCRVERVLQ